MENARPYLLGMFVLSLLGAPAFASDPLPQQESSSSPAVRVEIKNLQFVPSEVAIPAGTTIKWINLDTVDHDVTSGLSVNGRKARGLKQTRFPDKRFASGLFGTDKTFSVTFDEPGEYLYYCNIHPFMVARIKVK